MRQCMGCNEHKPKSELVRVVRAPDGSMSLDRTGKKPGRGAYVCSAQCLTRLRKSKRLEHTLETSIPDEVWNQLEKEFQNDAANV